MHQDIQEKVYEELHNIFEGSDRPVLCEDLPRMTYLERVIKETMRIFPVGPLIVRAISEDIILGKYIIQHNIFFAYYLGCYQTLGYQVLVNLLDL